MKLAAVVLAAGASRRMGQPKALLRWGDRTFLQHCIDRAAGVGADPIVVVQGAIDLAEAMPEATAPDGASPALRVVENPDWERGQLSSLQVGLSAIEPATSVLVLTVDRPHVAPATLSALVEAARTEPNAIWQPTFEGRHGHPILHPPDVVAALRALEPTASPRALLSRPEFAALRRAVEVDDPAVLDNLDRPEDLERLAPRP